MTNSRKRIDGFTLLELLVVVTLISIIATLAVFSLGAIRPDDHKLMVTQKRLIDLLELGVQESVLQGRPLSLLVSGENYQFLRYDNGDWSTYSGRGMLKPDSFIEGVVVELASDNVLGTDNNDKAMIFLPDGEVLLQALYLVDEYSNKTLQLAPQDGSYISQIISESEG